MAPSVLAPAPRTARARNRGTPARRIVRVLSALLISAGALLLVDAGLTVAWQEPVSALYATVRQDSLSGALRALDGAAPTALDARALGHLPDERRRIAFLARSLERRAPEGSAVGRIRIPRIGASFVMVKGTSASDLRGGPGIYPQTRFPGVPGTTAIAGHRTTYLAPFRHIDALRRGDLIVVQMPYGRFTYSVQGHRIVAPTDVAVIDPAGYSRLVLSACNPLYSAAQRIVVFARQVDVQARGAARVGA
jgi:sortase A